MGSHSFTESELARLAERMERRQRRREIPLRYLLDSRLFSLLCARGGAALDGFRASLARHGLAPEGGLPGLELTPLAFLDALGVEPPRVEPFPIPRKAIDPENPLLFTQFLARMARDSLDKAPELQAESLRKRVDEIRRKAGPAVHELLDLCLDRFVSREGFDTLLRIHLAFDFVYRFRVPEEVRERAFGILSAGLFGADDRMSGLSKMRIIKVYWDRSFERLLKKNPGAREEVLAADQEMRSWTFKDFLSWEAIHHSVLGYAEEERIHPVIAFTPDPEERLESRARAYKTALRALLDEFSREELATTMQPRLKAWKPGRLASCREDGTFDNPVSTGELPIF